MNITQITGYLLILGTVFTTVGFGLFSYRIYISSDPQEKTGLLASKPQRWTLSQSVVILGALITMAGSVFLFLTFRESQTASLFGIGGLFLVIGHIFWIWQLVLRIIHPEMFANDTLPGWLYTTYSIMTLLALSVIGVAFWLLGDYRVLGIGLLIASLVVLGLFLKIKDMPPEVYYLMTLAIGITLVL